MSLEASALLDRVIELGVRVTHLMIVGEEFEPFSQTRVIAMVLGQNGMVGRVGRRARRG